MARLALSLVVFSSVVGFAACSDGTSGGSRPDPQATGNTGNTGKGGSSTGGTGSSTGGTGSSTGGTGSSTGGTGSSTGGTTSASGFTCAGTQLTSAEITDFTTMGAMNTWGAAPALSGGVFVYPPAMTVDTSAGVLNVSGSVADYSGFGLWFTACSDATAFDGISFDISGNVGTSAKITVALQTHSDYPINTVDMKGGCAFASAATQYTDCVYPTVTKDVPEGGGTVTVAWSEFAGGKPVATGDASEIVGIQWSFAWAMGSTAYPIDVDVDNVHFLGDTVGAGGAGPGEGGAGPGEGGAGGG